MRLKYTLGIILLVTLHQTNCQRTNSEGSTDASSADIVANSVTNLAQKISRAIVSQRSKTEIFSPVSIAGALSLLLLGSGGTTRTELMDLMGFSNNTINFTEIHKGFGKLFRDLVSNDPSLKASVPWRENDTCNNVDYDDFTSSRSGLPVGTKGRRNRRDAEFDRFLHEIHIANGIFLDNAFNLNPTYDQTAKELYQSEVEKLDFVNSPHDATKHINNWVNQSTHGKIPEIFPGAVSSNTMMVIVSALYFKALWQEMFIEGGTKLRDFYPDGRNQDPIKVNMMAHGGCFPFYHSNELDASILGIPYKNKLTTMYVIKPDSSSRQVLHELIARLDGETINNMIDHMKMKTAVILFPKMHVTSTLNLKSTLKLLGVRSPFHPGRSDLSAISGSGSSPEQSIQARPAVNLPFYSSYKNKQKQPSNPNQLVFSRVDSNTDNEVTTSLPTTLDSTLNEEETDAPTTMETMEVVQATKKSLRSARDVSYKTPPETKGKADPLSSKDFFLNKRIVKPTGGKKARRSRREALQQLFVSDAIHKVELEINERGTEGGAATAITLNRSGTNVVFRADEPFLLLIRNDQTKLPLFFGAVYDPREYQSVEVNIGNGLFAQYGQTFDEKYKLLAEQLYQSNMMFLNYSTNPQKAVAIINDWVRERTRGKIPQIVNQLDTDTMLVIANTLYFKAEWDEPFLKDGTKQRKFFPNGPQKPATDVLMMVHGGCFPYYHWKEADVRVIGIPYKRNYTMYIFMPVNSDRSKLEALREKLNADNVNDIVAKMQVKTASIQFPKMHMLNSFSLKQVLEQLGASSIFDRVGSDLTRILAGPGAISRVDSSNVDDILDWWGDTKDNAEKKLQEAFPDCGTITEVDVENKQKCEKNPRCRFGGETCLCCPKTFGFRKRRNAIEQRLFVNEVIHKVDVVVNEKGTEGGAVTATLLDRITPQVNFRANGPFVMLIRDELTKLPLFYGSVYEPTS
ncbi:uncharacterized protein LOC128742043 [Sabethes cyaneus]|uniref:uncharacterized protein LOC128742043 n=1 Tax=Sabethes cyaneus TaxID=53552 RepID=UPI00237E401C|nr:uncharacterized protein LOC128742043 [Sabethes cyaneus]